MEPNLRLGLTPLVARLVWTVLISPTRKRVHVFSQHLCQAFNASHQAEPLKARPDRVKGLFNKGVNIRRKTARESGTVSNTDKALPLSGACAFAL